MLAVKILMMVGIGIPVTRLLARLAARFMKTHFSARAHMIVRKGVTYTGFSIIVVAVLGELGFHVSAIVGAAGIAGVAIGFASQTSVSNIISGLFLISERPFGPGDIVQIRSVVGTVLSIDLLSIKLRTADNRFVRIPNEDLIKTDIVNLTRFPIRRFDTFFYGPPTQDIAKTLTLLEGVAKKTAHALPGHGPVVIVDRMTETTVVFMVGIWHDPTHLTALRNQFFGEVQVAFKSENMGLSI